MGNCYKKFIGDKNGNLKALKIVELEWKFTEDGRPSEFVEVKNSEKEIPCELALLAMGFLYPQKEGVVNELEVELDERGNIKATEKIIKLTFQKFLLLAMPDEVNLWWCGQLAKEENAPEKLMSF